MKNVVYVKNISHFNKNKLKYNEIANKKSCRLWNVQRNMWWANIKTNIKNSNQEKYVFILLPILELIESNNFDLLNKFNIFFSAL